VRARGVCVREVCAYDVRATREGERRV